MTTSNRTSTEKETVNSQLFDKPQRRNVSSFKRSVISDPIVSINDRLEELSNLVAMMKDAKTKIESIKETFMDDLTSFLDDDDDSRPMITHTNDKNMKVFLQIRKTYEYSQQLVEKRTRIKNLQADLKAMEEKAVRDGKASLIKKDYSVIFKN